MKRDEDRRSSILGLLYVRSNLATQILDPGAYARSSLWSPDPYDSCIPQYLPWEMVLLPEGVSPLGGVVPLLGLMSLLLRCPYGGQNVGGAGINL